MRCLRRFFAASCLLPGLAAAEPPPTPPVDAAPPPAVDAYARGPSLEARLAEIRTRVQQALAYPPIARARGLRGETLVSFEIGADLRAAGVRTQRSSGFAVLDAAAEQAAREAAPLPFVYGRIEVPVRFELEGAGHP
jgi:protein TonB